MTTARYYNGTLQAGNIIINDDTFSNMSGDLNFSVTGSNKINFHLGNTLISYGGTGASVPPQRNPKVINIAPANITGADFNSIKDAVDSISDNSVTNQYKLLVAPGVYTENTITMKPYVDIEGSGLQLSTIRPVSFTGPIVIGKANCSLRGVYLHGATGGVAVEATNLLSVYPFRITESYFGSNQTHVKLTNSVAAPSLLEVSRCYAGGVDNFTTGFETISTNPSGISFMAINGLTVADFITPWFDTLIRTNGTGAQLVVNGMLTRITPTVESTTCFSIENGSECRAISNTIRGYERGFSIPNIGAPPKLEASGNNLECTLYNIDIQHPDALGSFTGYSEVAKTNIPASVPFFLTYKDPKIITVKKKGGDYTSIAAACDSITDASEINRYVIQISPGEYIEPIIDISSKPYVSVNGQQIQSAKILPDGDHHIFKIGQYNELSFLWLEGATTGYAGIYIEDSGDYSQAHKITIVDCDIGVHVKTTNTDTIFYGEYIDVNGTFTTGYKIEVPDGETGTSFANLENCYSFPTSSDSIGCQIDGVGAACDLLACGFDFGGNDNTNVIGIEVKNGASVALSAVYINNHEVGLMNPNTGFGCDVKMAATNFTLSSLYDFNIANSSTKVSFQGSAQVSKINNVSDDTAWYFVDSATRQLEVTNKINMTFNNSDRTDLTTLLLEGGTMGVIEGAEFSIVSNTTVQVSAGYGYVDDQFSDVVKRIDWSTQNITLPSYGSQYLYFTVDGNLSASSTEPSSEYNIILGKIDTYNNEVILVEHAPVRAHHAGNINEKFNRVALGSIFNNGSIVSATGTRQLNVTSGQYFYGSQEFNPTGGNAISFGQIFRNTSITGGYDFSLGSTSTVDNTQYDNGGNALTNIGSSRYAKHSLYLSGDENFEKYFLVFGQTTYATLVEAEGGDIPLPPSYFNDSVVLIANIIVQQANSNIVEIQDARPTLSYKASGVTASANHSNLFGLNNDDHTQYLLVNGGRNMAGNLNMGGNSITGASTINLVQIESHASRHQPNATGADRLLCSIVSTVGTANTTGTSNFFARSDHVHSHGNQTSGTLHAVASTTVNGFLPSSDKIILNAITGGQFITTSSITGLSGARTIGNTFFINNTHITGSAGIVESKLALNFPTHTNVNDPTSDQKAALTGSFGLPSDSNRYVTSTDPRVNSNPLVPVGDVTTDMANLASVANAQYSKNQPIYLHDIVGANVNIGTPLYFNATTSDNVWNQLTWIGVGTSGATRAPFVAFTGAGCIFSAPSVFGLSFSLLGANTTATLNGGASVTTSWQIGDIYTDTSASQSVTFLAGKYLIGRINFPPSGSGKKIIMNDRTDIKLTTLSLNGGSLYVGSNCTLDVDLCSGSASTIYIGANDSLSPQSNSHVLTQTDGNNTFEIYGTNNRLDVSNSGITVKSSAVGAIILGNGNTITIESGATNTIIIGENTISNSGTNTVELSSTLKTNTIQTNTINSSTGAFVNLSSSSAAFSGTTSLSGDVNISGSTILTNLVGNDITGASCNLTGGLNVAGSSTLGNILGNDITGASLNSLGGLSVAGSSTLGNVSSGIVTGTSLNSLGGLNVIGSSSFRNNVSISGSLNVNNLTGSNANLTGSLNVIGASTLGTLFAGTGTFGNTVVTNLRSGDANLTGSLNVIGASNLGTLFAGTSTFANTTVADFTGSNISSNGILRVLGTSTLGNVSSGILTGASLNSNGGLNVVGTSTLGNVSSGILTGTSLNSNGGLNVVDSSSFRNNVSISGVVSLSGALYSTSIVSTGAQSLFNSVNISGALTATGATNTFANINTASISSTSIFASNNLNVVGSSILSNVLITGGFTGGSTFDFSNFKINPSGSNIELITKQNNGNISLLPTGTGQVLVKANPISSLGIANKGYVDSLSYLNLSGEASTTGGQVVTLSNSAVIGKLLTGFVSGSGDVSASDSILQSIQKLDGKLSGTGASRLIPYYSSGSNKVLTNDSRFYFDSSGSGILNVTNITGATELVLGQGGDQFGDSRLIIRNRNAENGVIIETINPPTPVTDLIIKNSAAQRNIRMESRTNYARAGSSSFHIGGTNPDDPTISVGDTYINSATGSSMCIGAYFTPSAILQVVNPTAATSNIRISNSTSGTTATDGFELGYGTNAFINNRENTSLTLSTNNTTRLTVASGGDISVTSTTPSTSSTNGSFVTPGGIGVGGSLFLGISLNTPNVSISGTSVTCTPTNTDLLLNTNGTGRVSVVGDPTSNLHVATKLYVDDIFKRITVYKSTNEDRNNTGFTYVNDSVLSNIPISTVGVYLITGMIFAQGATNRDLAIQFSYPPSSVIRGRMNKFGSGNTNALLNASPQAITNLSLNTTAQFSDVLEIEIVVNALSTGMFDFAWRQNSTGVEIITIVAGSYFQIRQIA